MFDKIHLVTRDKVQIDKTVNPSDLDYAILLHNYAFVFWSLYFDKLILRFKLSFHAKFILLSLLTANVQTKCK